MALGDRTEITINDNTFYVMMFEPFKSFKILGELQRIVAPILGKLAGGVLNNTDVLDKELSDLQGILPALDGALKEMAVTLDGDKLEKLLDMLLNPQYISVLDKETDKVKQLDKGMINKVFTGDVASMAVLAFKVAEVNYKSFFSISKILSGVQKG